MTGRYLSAILSFKLIKAKRASDEFKSDEFPSYLTPNDFFLVSMFGLLVFSSENNNINIIDTLSKTTENNFYLHMFLATDKFT